MSDNEGLPSRELQIDSWDVITMLQDQLEGYREKDIAREILQNADDAGAERLDFYIVTNADSRAPHPLLRRPGLLIYNDGTFREEDGKGILRIIGGSKQADYNKIGRFGLGLKSVFNICDAFFYCSHIPSKVKDNRIGGLLDPYKKVREEYGRKGKLEIWKDISGDPGEYLDDIVRKFVDKSDRKGFIIFIPFRSEAQRDYICIKKEYYDAGDVKAILGESLGRFYLSLGLLKNVSSVTAFEAESLSELGKAHEWFSIKASGKLPLSKPGEKGEAFERRLEREIVAQGKTWKCFGAETFQPQKEIFQKLKNNPNWPLIPGNEERQKAAAHAAVAIMGNGKRPGKTLGRWASFLPLSESEESNNQTVIDLGEASDGAAQCEILLHGFFFLKSDRKNIPGVTNDASGIEADWNRAIFEYLIAPLAPRALYEFLINNAQAGEIAEVFKDWLKGKKLLEKACSCHNLAYDAIAEKWVLLNNPVYPLPQPIPQRLTKWLEKRSETFIVAGQGLYSKKELATFCPSDFLPTMFKYISEKLALNEKELAFIDSLLRLEPYEAEAETCVRQWMLDLLKAGLFKSKSAISDPVKQKAYELAENYLEKDLLFLPMATEPALRKIAQNNEALLKNVLPLPARLEQEARKSKPLREVPRGLFEYLGKRLEEDAEQSDSDIALADALAKYIPADLDSLKLFRVAIFKDGKRLYGEKDAARSRQALAEKSASGLLFQAWGNAWDDKLLKLYSLALDANSEIWRQRSEDAAEKTDKQALCLSINRNLHNLSPDKDRRRPFIEHLLKDSAEDTPEGVMALIGLLAGTAIGDETKLFFSNRNGQTEDPGLYFIDERWKKILNGEQIEKLGILDEEKAKEWLLLRLIKGENPHKYWSRVKELCPEYLSLRQDVKELIAVSSWMPDKSETHGYAPIHVLPDDTLTEFLKPNLPGSWIAEANLFDDAWLLDMRKKILEEKEINYAELFNDKDFKAPVLFFPTSAESWVQECRSKDLKKFAPSGDSREEKLLAVVLNYDAGVQRKFAGDKPQFGFLLNAAADYYHNNKDEPLCSGIIEYAKVAIKNDEEIFKKAVKFPTQKKGIWKTGREIVNTGINYAPEQMLEKKLWNFYQDRENATRPTNPGTAEQDYKKILKDFFNNPYALRHTGFIAQFCALIAGTNRSLKEFAAEQARMAQLTGSQNFVEEIREKYSPDNGVWNFKIILKITNNPKKSSLAGTPFEGDPTNSSFFAADPVLTKVLDASGKDREVYIYEISLLSDSEKICLANSDGEFKKKLTHSLELWLDSLRLSLNHQLWRDAASPQSSLDETKKTLRAELKSVCRILKIQDKPKLKTILDKLDEAIRKDKYKERAKIEDELYAAARECSEILTETTEYIRRMGYREEGVLLELIQNADDALRQEGTSRSDKSVSVTLENGLLELRHCGRPINYTIHDRPEYQRDLYNMLMLNSSEKGNEDETGKLGLGFKSVFLVCNEPVIHSGNLSFKIHNALFPEFPEDTVSSHSKEDYMATIFSLKLRDDVDENALFSRLDPAAPLIPVFAREIISLTLAKNGTKKTFGFNHWDPGDRNEWVMEDRKNNILCFYMDNPGASVAISLDSEGIPRKMPEKTPPLWHTMPMLEGGEWNLGYAINAPFIMDAGRARFAMEEENDNLLQDIGQTLGKLICELAENRKKENHETYKRFCSGLWNVFTAGVKPDMNSNNIWSNIVKNLHTGDNGLSHWLKTPGTIGSSVPEKWSWPLKNVPKVWNTCELACTDIAEIFKSLQRIPKTNLQDFAFVSSHTASVLELLDFKIEKLEMESFFLKLFTCILVDKKLCPDIFQIIKPFKGDIASLRSRENPFWTELRVMTQAGTWENIPSVLLPPDLGEGFSAWKRDMLLSGFAPDNYILSKEYIKGQEDAAFYSSLRNRSEIAAEMICDWIKNVNEEQRLAVLRYLAQGEDLKQVRETIQNDSISWLEDHEIVERLGRENHIDVSFHKSLYSHNYKFNQHVSFCDNDLGVPASIINDEATSYFHERQRAWNTSKYELKQAYREATYPKQFQDDAKFKAKLDANDRLAWLTLLLIGCLQSVGRTQPQTIRNFVDSFINDYFKYFETEYDPKDPDWLEFICNFEEKSRDRIGYAQLIGIFPFFHQLSRYLKQYRTQISTTPRKRDPLYAFTARIDSEFSGGGKNFDSPPFPAKLGKYWVLRELCRLNVGNFRQGGDKFFEYCWVPRSICAKNLGINVELDPEDRREQIVTTLRWLNKGTLPTFDYWFDIALCP